MVEPESDILSITLVESLTTHVDAMPDMYENEGVNGCPSIPNYIEAELQQQQRSDTVIGRVIDLLEIGDKATPNLSTDSLELKLMLKE